MHEWYLSECAPVTAPVEILSGQITTRDGSLIRMAAGRVLNNGWGALGATLISDPVCKALPQGLQISWFSYTENTFYKGDFQFDAVRLDDLFEAGYQRPSHAGTSRYDRIVVGMAPGGGVAVWLKGELITRELQFFRATDVQENWSSFSDGSPRPRGEFVQAQLDQLFDPAQLAIALQTSEAGRTRWEESYRLQFDWAPRFTSRGRIRQLVLRYWNGEVLLDDMASCPRLHAIPAQIDLYWGNPDGVNYGATLSFDFAEISAAFGRLSPGGPLRLELEADTLSVEVAVFLSNATDVYRFRKAAIRVFQQ